METFKVKLITDEFVVEDTTNKNDVKIFMLKGEKGDPGAGAIWGTIEGDISDQTDLINLIQADLTNYYTKSETYTKSEVNNLISTIPEFSIEVVQTLPTTDISTTTIYLVPKTGTTGDVYNEYIYINSNWELIGSTEVDLTNYYTKTQTDNLLNNKQATLVSGTNIKTINNNSILGSGNLNLGGGTATDVQINGSSIVSNDVANIVTEGTYNSSTNKIATMSDIPAIPTKTSDLNNDSGFIDNTVNNLVNYFKKTDDTLPVYFVDEEHSSSNNAFVLAEKPKGLYIFGKNTTQGFNLYLKPRDGATVKQYDCYGFFMLYIKDVIPTIYTNDIKIYAFEIQNNGFRKREITVTENSIGSTETSTSAIFVTENRTQTITGEKTFSTLPKSSVTPTDNDEFTRKGYVDTVVESGSNANGNYIKYANGELICYTSSSQQNCPGYTNTTFSITLPATYIDTNYTCLALKKYGGAYWANVFEKSQPVTTSTAEVNAWNEGANTAEDIQYNIVTMGRWKA